MVASGIREAGKEPVLIPAEEAAAEQLSSFQAAAFGCPSMGDGDAGGERNGAVCGGG